MNKNEFEHIINYYENDKLSLECIATKFNTTRYQIKKILIDNNITIRKKWESKNLSLDKYKDEIIKMYISGYSTRYIGNKFNTNKNTITKFLRNNNIKINNKCISKLEQSKNDIVKLYTENLLSIKEISKLYNHSESAIRKLFYRHDISLDKSKNIIHKKYYNEVKKLYEEGYSSLHIANRLKINKTTILRILKRLNIETRTLTLARRIYNIDENIFDQVDTEEKAYFLGLLYADGNNFPRTHLISLPLHKKDKKLLKKFKHFIKSDAPIKKIKKDINMLKFTITNKHLSEQLEKLGVVKNKTFKLVFPTFINKNLESHFIRGYFDGDGGVTLTPKSLECTITGTEQFVSRIQEILIRECELPKTKLDTRHPDRFNNIRTCRYSGRLQLIKIMNYIYNNATIFLDRKYQNFLSIKNHEIQLRREYNLECCWQYNVRISSLEEDLYRLKLTKDDISKFTVKDFDFVSIVNPTKQEYMEIKKFIIKYEWLRKMPNRPSHYFVSRLKSNSELAGVIILSTPNMFSHLLGKDNKDLERLISRGACASWTPKNMGSWMIMKSLNWMVNNTKYRIFTSYADPEAKEIGTIYQACNFTYLGYNYRKKRELYFDSDNPHKGWFSERHFTHKAAYIRYLKNLGLYDEFLKNKDWFVNYTLNWEKIPSDIIKKIKREIINVKNKCLKKQVSPKHKYVYILGENKKETKELRKLFFNKNKKLIKNYPKKYPA